MLDSQLDRNCHVEKKLIDNQVVIYLIDTQPERMPDLLV